MSSPQTGLAERNNYRVGFRRRIDSTGAPRASAGDGRTCRVTLRAVRIRGRGLSGLRILFSRQGVRSSVGSALLVIDTASYNRNLLMWHAYLRGLAARLAK